MALLELKNLHVALEDGTEIVKGVDLAVSPGEVHAVMGPNGSGKSTLAYALMGHPAYEITEGQLLFDGEDLTEAGADERAQKGLFLAFQYPHAIPGVTVTSFLRSAINAIRKARNGGVDDPIPVKEFRTELLAAMDRLKVPRELASRYLNDGFSGGEKKRVEILQMAMLEPRIAVLDETDSGLDIDALKIVAGGVKDLVGPEMGALVITHYQRILNYITPDFVHVFVGGRIVEEGGPELAHKLEAEGYEAFTPKEPGSGDVVAQTETEVVQGIGTDYERKYGFSNPDEAKDYFFKSGRGLNHEIVEAISQHKNEPEWMRKFRHKSLDYFLARPLPQWGGNVNDIDFENIYYYIRPTEKQADSWEDLPADIKDTWDKLGIPEAEKKYLAGVGAQYESEVVYHKLQESLEKQGVIFLDMDSGAPRPRGARQAVLRDDHPAERQQVRGAQLGRVVGRVVHLRAARREDRAAAPGLLPHQRGEHGPVRAHADPRRRGRVRALRRGLHRADLLVRLAALGSGGDRGQEGRALPLHDDPELVEQRLQPRHEARRRLRGRHDGVGRREPRLEADDEVSGDLADGRARARRGLSIAFAGKGQHQDAGGKCVHVAPEDDVGDHVEVDLTRRRARGLPRPARGREGRARREVEGRLRRADPRRGVALDTYPYIRIDESDVNIGHEATVSKIGEEQLFYLMSRGLSEAEASALIVSGFVEPITKELPLEYAVEMNRLIQLQMEGSVG